MNKQSHSLSSNIAHARAFSEWLLSSKFNWNVFATFTTQYRLSRNAARNLIERLNQNVANKLQCPLNSFWVAEKFESKGGYHLHALYETNKDTQTLIKSIEKDWFIVSRFKGDLAENLIEIEEYNKEERGASYFTKSLRWKDAEYDFVKYIPDLK